MTLADCQIRFRGFRGLADGVRSSIIPSLNFPRHSNLNKLHVSGRIYETASSFTNCNCFFRGVPRLGLRTLRCCQGHRQRTCNGSSLRPLWRRTMPKVVWRKRKNLSTRLWRRTSAQFSLKKPFSQFEEEAVPEQPFLTNKTIAELVDYSPAFFYKLCEDVMDGDKVNPTKHQTFRLGDTVRIMSGPFSSFTGKIQGINQSKALLLIQVTIYGRSQPITLKFADVEVVSFS